MTRRAGPLYVWYGVTWHVPTPAPPRQKLDTTRQIARADVQSGEHLLHCCAFGSILHLA